MACHSSQGAADAPALKPQRPSFTSDGHSDTKTEYGLFVWQKEWTGGSYGLFLWEKGWRCGTEVCWIMPETGQAARAVGRTG